MFVTDLNPVKQRDIDVEENSEVYHKLPFPELFHLEAMHLVLVEFVEVDPHCSKEESSACKDFSKADLVDHDLVGDNQNVSQEELGELSDEDFATVAQENVSEGDATVDVVVELFSTFIFVS